MTTRPPSTSSSMSSSQSSSQSSSESPPLDGVHVVLFAVNVPGPVAATRLQTLGARVTKIEPPAGDQLERLCPAWYADINRDFTIRRLDLRDADGREALDALLDAADLFLTSYRPSSLQRLGLDRASLAARHPALDQVAIVGEAGPLAELAGHDLTYQAGVGLLVPPAMPRTLLADLTGAERAATAAVALLAARWRVRGDGAPSGGYAEVALADAVKALLPPLRFGLTTADGALGGTSPFYGLYATRDGWIAVAALESHFARRLLEALGMDEASRAAFAAVFATDTAAAWEAWAETRDLPIVAVRESSAANVQNGSPHQRATH